MDKEEWRGDSPIGLRRYGREFVTVGHDALKAHRTRNPCTLLDQHLGAVAPDAIYYNFMHGVELGLKSYLRHTDAVPLRSLRRRSFGHDLSRLLDESIEHGLRTACPELRDIHIEAIRCGNELYKAKEFEYIWIGFSQYPPIDAIAEASETLMTELKKLPMKPATQP